MKLSATSANLPITRHLTPMYALSSIVAALMVAVSAAGIVLGLDGLYGADPKLALGVTEAEARLLVPGLLGQDIFNLAVGLPLLLGSMWLARRGTLIGLLLWPGALFYVLYWYVLYLVGAPFRLLFLPQQPVRGRRDGRAEGPVTGGGGDDARHLPRHRFPRGDQPLQPLLSDSPARHAARRRLRAGERLRGIAAATLNWGVYVPGGIGLFLFTLSVLPLAIWNVLVARRLFQLGRASWK